jgi:hypothetical protein
VNAAETQSAGWRRLTEGYPWFSGKGRFPITAYSEFMPPPRLGQRPYEEADTSLFNDDDPYGWYTSEVEQEFELNPGLQNLANQIVREIADLGQGKPAWRIAGNQKRNLENNPYWPPELAVQAGKLSHERYVVILPLSLSRTQDDKGRVRWTLFGSSEQGPERAFWKSFYLSPSRERPTGEIVSYLAGLVSPADREACQDISGLTRTGFRILPSDIDPQFPYWHLDTLPTVLEPLLCHGENVPDDTRYLLTFRPFSRLPGGVRRRYLAGEVELLPFPGSLVFWGMPAYRKLQAELPMAMQLPLQRLAARKDGPDGLRIPQSGWFSESGADYKPSQVSENLLVNTYKRTSRWDKAQRYQDDAVLSTIEDSLARVLFSTHLDVMGLYGKPMARNCQLWTEDSRLLLNGPEASCEELEKAAETIARGGAFRYRFQFPAMRVGRHEVYWQRPLVACWSRAAAQAEIMAEGPAGYFTAYLPDRLDLAHPVELWPRMMRREAYLQALNNFNNLNEYYAHQTALNAVRLLDTWRRWGQKPLPRSFARQVLRLPEHQPLESWLAGLPDRAESRMEGDRLRQEIERRLEPRQAGATQTYMPGMPPPANLPPSLTFAKTATRAFETAWWQDIQFLMNTFVNTNNADCILDEPTQAHLAHNERDLERLGDYLLSRYRQEISDAGMDGRATAGELPFHWGTDFKFSLFGGWQNNHDGHAHERDLVVIIPGKNRREAVVMADHYDTAYMHDIYEKSEGGTGARLSAAGADDNFSATATLLQSASVFLQMAGQGLLERDIWLVHLTGEEFPSDCLGARHLARSLVEKSLFLQLDNHQQLDLSDVKVVGVYVLDMIGHNRESDMDEFQISPGKGRTSLRLAWQAHIANVLWNVETKERNLSPERRGKGRGRRISRGIQIPGVAEHLRLQGEVRLPEDPRSSLFNTDGQIFSDCGIPVVLFMENYDIDRSGYHDTKDTMENIDLDYGAALASIAIETVAQAASRREI